MTRSEADVGPAKMCIVVSFWAERSRAPIVTAFAENAEQREIPAPVYVRHGSDWSRVASPASCCGGRALAGTRLAELSPQTWLPVSADQARVARKTAWRTATTSIDPDRTGRAFACSCYMNGTRSAFNGSLKR